MKLKRFYKSATADKYEDGYGVFLDGKPIRTAGKRPLVVPVLPLAQTVAQEWEHQRDSIDPMTMPQMRLVNTALDRIFENRAEIHANILAYGENELLCYRDGNVTKLRERQAEKWNPWIGWAEQWTGHGFVTTENLMPVLQSDEIKSFYDGYLTSLDMWAFTALVDLVQSTGSFILGSATLQGAMTSDDAFVLSRLDYDFQSAIWGRDEEEYENAETLRTDMSETENFLRYLGKIS